MELNLSTADEVVVSEGIAVPHCKIQLPKPFNEREHKLFLKCGVFTAVGASPGAKLGAAVFQTDVWILSRNPLGILQLSTPDNCDLKKLALNRHLRVRRRGGEMVMLH